MHVARMLTRLALGRPRTPSALAPTIDLERRTVCDLGRSDTRDSIEKRLGPPGSFWQRRKGQLVYSQIGLQVSIDDRFALIGVSVFFAGVAEQYRWGPTRAVAPPTEAQAIALLGPPTKREVDAEEIMLEWTAGGVFLGLDYALDGTLADLFIDFD